VHAHCALTLKKYNTKAKITVIVIKYKLEGKRILVTYPMIEKLCIFVESLE
jgi:hypothetical protein